MEPTADAADAADAASSAATLGVEPERGPAAAGRYGPAHAPCRRNGRRRSVVLQGDVREIVRVRSWVSERRRGPWHGECVARGDCALVPPAPPPVEPCCVARLPAWGVAPWPSAGRVALSVGRSGTRSAMRSAYSKGSKHYSCNIVLHQHTYAVTQHVFIQHAARRRYWGSALG